MKKNKIVEKRILEQIFNCSQEELERILSCYRNFEEKFYQYPIQKLIPTIFEEPNDCLKLPFSLIWDVSFPLFFPSFYNRTDCGHKLF